MEGEEHARHGGAQGPPPSTQPDESVEDVDVSPEPSSNSVDRDEELKMEGEEHARSGIGDGEPKVKGVDELVEDVDVLQESSSDSRGEDRRRDPTGEDPGDGGVPKPDQDLHGMDPEVAGDLRWSLRKKRAPCGGRLEYLWNIYVLAAAHSLGCSIPNT